jgi:hypothetical protein
VDPIKLAAENLMVGDSVRGVCPKCEGGSSKEASFVIWCSSPGSVGYKCYRDSCGNFGSLKHNHKIDWVAKPATKHHKFPYQTEQVPIGWCKYLSEKYELSLPQILRNFKWVSEVGGLYTPLIDATGGVWGAQLKLLGKNPEWPWIGKVRTYKFKEAARISWCNSKEPGPLVIVEDVISAVKLSRFTPSLALLGTSLSPQVAREISDMYSSVIFALDPDTWEKDQPTSLALGKRYAHLFLSVNHWLLTEDPKDTPYERLEELLSERTQDIESGVEPGTMGKDK